MTKVELILSKATVERLVNDGLLCDCGLSEDCLRELGVSITSLLRLQLEQQTAGESNG